MKITIEHYGDKFTFEKSKEDITLEELHELWIRCLIAMTFPQEMIDKFYE